MDRLELPIALLVLLVACGGEETLPPPPPVDVTVTVTHAASDDPMPNIEVCVENFTGFECQTSDAAGVVTIQSPANSEVLYSFTGMDLYPGLHMLTTGETDAAFEAEVAQNAIVNVVVASSMMTLTPGTSLVLLRAIAATGTGDPTGFTFALEPAPAAGTIVYFDESQVPTVSLTETTLTGAAAVVNLTPGDYDVVVTHASRACDVEVGWERSATARVGLRAGAEQLTVVKVVNCM